MPLTIRLSCFERIGQPEALYPLDDARVIIQYGTLADSGVPGEEIYGVFLALIDTQEDSILYEAPSHLDWGETILGIRDNGEIVTAYPSAARLGFYKQDLTFDRELQLPDELSGASPIYDPVGDRLYYCTLNKLYEVTIDGEVSLVAEFGEYDSLCAYDPASGIAFYETPDEAALYGSSLVAYDTMDGSVLYSAPTSANAYFLHEEQLATCSERPLPSSEGVINKTIFTLFGEDHNPQKAFILNNRFGLAWQEGAGLAFGLDYISRPDSLDPSVLPLFFDFDSGLAAEVPLENQDIFDFKHCYLDDGRYLLASCASSPDAKISGMGLIELYVINTDNLDFSREITPAEPDTDENNRKQLEINRQALRAMADEIEQEFDITIILGDDCLKADQPDGHSALSTDAVMRDASSEVSEMLCELRRHLALYPDGFFETFKDKNRGCGLRILAVSELTMNAHASFATSAVFYRYFDWYNIMADVNEIISSTNTLPHELWHAVESKIWAEYFGSFYDRSWDNLNPDGFTGYFYDVENYQQMAEPWERYILETGDDPYFVRSYSLVDPKEDRATLIELLFNHYFGEDPVTSAEALASCPHLKAKLDYMAELVRKVFGTVYWE
ncbi:MAG: hypothetical protein IJM90_08450 [Firmicutes bacterium]|nr:hypothetical protein [Bacillota bacterium]